MHAALSVWIWHGTADQMLPIQMARELHRAARPPVQLVEIDGAGHNDTFVVNPARYFQAIDSFIAQHVPSNER